MRVVLLNEFPLTAHALAQALRAVGAGWRVEALARVSEIVGPVDLVLFDPTTAPATTRWALLREVQRHPHVAAVAVYAGHLPDEWRRTARECGVEAHISKTVSAPDLRDSIVRLCAQERVPPGPARRGVHWPGREEGLSRRESQTLALIATGAVNDEIAERLHLSINSVKSYIRTAYRKIGAERRSQAVLWAIEHHITIDQHPLPTAPHAGRHR